MAVQVLNVETVIGRRTRHVVALDGLVVLNGVVRRVLRVAALLK